MTRYIKIGHDIVDSKDIEQVYQDIAGISIRSIKPNQKIHLMQEINVTEINIDDPAIIEDEITKFKKSNKSVIVDTISEILTKFYMIFLITNRKAQLKMFEILGFGKSYSTIQTKLEHNEKMIYQPKALHTGDRIEPKTLWLHPVPQPLSKYNIIYL